SSDFNGKLYFHHVTVLPLSVERHVSRRIRNSGYTLPIYRHRGLFVDLLDVRVQRSWNGLVTRPPGNAQLDDAFHIVPGRYGDRRFASPRHLALDRERDVLRVDLERRLAG